MQTDYRCKKCGVEGTAEFFSEDNNICNECANATLQNKPNQNSIEPKGTLTIWRSNKVLLTLYAIACLFVHMKVSAYWSGYAAGGILFAIVSFGFPVIITYIISDVISNKRPELYFNEFIIGIILLCSILLFIFYSTFMGVHI
jgi:hypothetical protein